MIDKSATLTNSKLSSQAEPVHEWMFNSQATGKAGNPKQTWTKKRLIYTEYLNTNLLTCVQALGSERAHPEGLMAKGNCIRGLRP